MPELPVTNLYEHDTLASRLPFFQQMENKFEIHFEEKKTMHSKEFTLK